MKVFECYFERHGVSWLPDFTNDPEVIVIIPVFNDRDVFATIDSLCGCSCKQGSAGVILVVNHSERCVAGVKQANRDLAEELRQYVRIRQDRKPEMDFIVTEAFDLPVKSAGVGLARKIAMDAAAFFFYRNGKTENPILSLDADTLVEPNYLDETLRFFRSHSVAGVSVAYAHRLDEEECRGEVREAMIKYELYLRYYQLALEYSGHPHAFHCIGSAFAVRTSDYVAQGGMNKRQAGEDFYFLQKLIATGRYATLKSTRVYPSARFSARTPFGTGQSVRSIVEHQGDYPVYNFEAFRALKVFFAGLPCLYKADKVAVSAYFDRQTTGVKAFLAEMDGVDRVAEVNANCASPAQFSKRFFDYFNAFRVLKYLNYVHEGFYSKTDISEAVEVLFAGSGYPFSASDFENLEYLRYL